MYFDYLSHSNLMRHYYIYTNSHNWVLDYSVSNRMYGKIFMFFQLLLRYRMCLTVGPSCCRARERRTAPTSTPSTFSRKRLDTGERGKLSFILYLGNKPKTVKITFSWDFFNFPVFSYSSRALNLSFSFFLIEAIIKFCGFAAFKVVGYLGEM